MARLLYAGISVELNQYGVWIGRDGKGAVMPLGRITPAL